MEERKKIKIMHLRSSGGFYGAEKVILTIATELNQRGCDNHIICINNLKNPHAELVDEAQKVGIKASFVDSIGLLDWQAIKELRHIINQEQFDVLHFHDYKASVYGFLASWWLAPKRVVTNHLWDKIDWKLWIYQRLEGFLYNKFDRVIAVSEKVKSDIRPFIIHKSRIEVITNGIDCAAFSAPAQRIKDKGLRIKQSQDSSSFTPHPSSSQNLRSEFGLDDKDVVIGIVGRLARQKGHEYLLRAFAKLLAKDEGLMIKDQERENNSSFIPHPLSLKLLIVGDGALDDELKDLCRELNLSFTDLADVVSSPESRIPNPVIFAGVQTDMPAVYNMLDILVMPSLEEGLPMVLLEAMSAGVPVVTTPVGQIPEIIKDGETGFLVEPRDVGGLVDVLTNILENGILKDEGLRIKDQEKQNNLSFIPHSLSLTEIVSNARKLVEEKHSSQAMAKKYLETYEWLVE